jgi:hypothetical protein
LNAIIIVNINEYKQTNRQTNSWTDRQTNSWTDRQIVGRRTDRRTDGWTNKLINKQFTVTFAYSGS